MTMFCPFVFSPGSFPAVWKPSMMLVSSRWLVEHFTHWLKPLVHRSQFLNSAFEEICLKSLLITCTELFWDDFFIWFNIC